MNNDALMRYPQSWYPILRSNELRKNKSHTVKAFAQEWLVFRDADDQVGVVSRYCCHMGTDLSNGNVLRGGIECPLHGWQFDKTGACQFIPSLKSNIKGILSDRALNSFLCKETYGIIFVFFGDEPAFDIPLPPSMTSITTGNCSLFNLATEFHVPCLNTFDLQHYRYIHHRKIVAMPDVEQLNLYHMGIKMNAEVLPVNLLDRVMKWLFQGCATISIDCWGASLLLMNNNKTGYGAVIAMLPVEQYQSTVFIVPVKNASKQQTLFTQIQDKVKLNIAARMIRGFLLADKKALRGMKPVEGCLLEELDDAAKKYWQYFNALPRYSKACPMKSQG